MRIGFIGAGAMGTAIISGLVSTGVTAAKDIAVTDINADKARELAEQTGTQYLATSKEIAAHSTVIVLAVKPQHLSEALETLAKDFPSNPPIVVSIAAGRSLESIENLLPPKTAVVRVMPNVNASIGQSISGICGGLYATGEDTKLVRELFAAVGRTELIDEDLFPVFAALAGCSPAWVFIIIDSLARAALAQGIPKAQAVTIAAQAVSGSAQLVLDQATDGVIPASLVDRVCSPGGTTVAGLLAGEKAGLSVSLVKALNAAVQRDREISGSD